MEILFVSHKHPPFTGGMEKQSFELINGMRHYASVHSIVYDGQQSRIRFFLTLRRRIYRCLRRHPGISMVHFNDGLMAAYCCRFRKFPHVKRSVTLHGLDVVFPNRFFQKHLLPAFNRFDLVIAVSRATADAAIRRGLCPGKLVTIANGVDTCLTVATGQEPQLTVLQQQFGFDLQQQQVLVGMGRLVKRKGFSWFIRNVLPRLDKNVVFVMIGPLNRQRTLSARLMNLLPAFLQQQLSLLLGYPSDEQTIRELLATTGGRNYLHLGRLPFPVITNLLNQAAAFVMPNLPMKNDMEGFGLVCLEACLCEATVFAAATDGITDAISDGNNGYLLPAGDAAAWADGLNRFLRSTRADRPRLPARAYTIDHYGWDKMVSQYYHHFRAAGC